MSNLIFWPLLAIWYAAGLLILRRGFRRAMVRGIAAQMERWPRLFPTIQSARREWLSCEGGILLVLCFLGAMAWPLALLTGAVARTFLAPVPAERAERISQLERELGMNRRG